MSVCSVKVCVSAGEVMCLDSASRKSGFVDCFLFHMGGGFTFILLHIAIRMKDSR